MLDLLIRGGMIIDGTGSPGYWGSVGIEGDQVRIIRGDVSEVEALRTMDAKGLMVAPGFIDVHAHSGLMILAEPRHEPKVLQGVTTELVGVDGNSYAPFKRAQDLRDFIRLNAGLDGDPDLKKLWTSVSDYLGRFDGKVAVNIAYMVGNSPLRINAVGWENRKATAREISVMRGLLREAMEEGAFGLSTGLDYPPGSYADTEEVAELCRESARLGGIYHTHVRYWLGDRYLDPFREALDIGRRSGVAVHITHLFHRRPRRGSAKRMLGLVEEARDGGMDVTFDCFPYPYGGTRLLIMLPQWAHDGGPSKLKAVLTSEEGRERLRREVTPRAPSWDDLWLTYFRKPHNRQYDGLSVAEIAERMGKGPVDAICDLLVDEDLGISYTGAVVEPSTLPKFVEHELYMVGSDALLVGEHLSPMAYGTFPYILGEYVREEGRLRLEEAVRKMTGFPSQRLGLRDRGLLRDGMKADVVVFDAGRVGSEASMKESKKPPVGIEYVIVNGKVVVERGKHTGTLAGRAVRRG